MVQRLILMLLALVWPLGARAEVPVLAFPLPAEETAARVEGPAGYGFAIGPFDGQRVPLARAEGQLVQRAWRMAGLEDTVLGLSGALERQLVQAGYEVSFACEAVACGGFDFRYGMEVLPEPDMHVDLGDYRYALAKGPKGEMVALLVSRALDIGFVQMTYVGEMAAGVPEVVAEATETVALAAPEDVPEVGAGDATVPVVADASAPQAGDLAAELSQRGAAVLEDLVFGSGKAKLDEGDYPSLAALAAWLKANPDQTVTLVGHTDASGGLAGNVALSRQRAEAVRAWLVARLGADAARIGAEGVGYLAPRASNQTPEGRQRNRRVEVMVTSTPVGIPAAE